MAVFMDPCRWMAIFLSTCLMSVSIIQAKTVTTGSGMIRGFPQVIDGVNVDTYLGIPFAEPPVGPLRFRKPEPASAWSDVRDAMALPNACMQSRDTYFGDFSGSQMWNPNTNVSDDCLYLNLWVPNASASLATIVWIYGGSFVSGSSSLGVYDGAYLAAKKSVIVASMNYRLGIHGFLYSGTDEAPGNMAFLDQQMAMKWIYENIKDFGGDDSKITLTGESAGSGSVSYHLIAPTSWPYFNNAIMLSATVLCPWAWVEEGAMLKKLKSLAALVDCENEDNDEIVKCLRNIDGATLEAKQWEIENGHVGTFLPVTDGRFLTASPQTLISNGKVKNADIILGNTKDEGEYFMIYFYPDVIKPSEIQNPKTITREQLQDMVVQTTGIKRGLELETLLYVYEQSLLPSSKPSYRDMMDEILGDYLFKCGVLNYASQFSSMTPKKGQTYMYSFNYRHSLNPWPLWMGALHGYEIEMVFGLPLNPNLNYNAEDRRVSEYIMEYFTSFAKTGSPNGIIPTTWPEFSSDQEQHMVITDDASLTVENNFRRKECTFWNQLLPEIRRSMDKMSTTSTANVIPASYHLCTGVIIALYCLRSQLLPL